MKLRKTHSADMAQGRKYGNSLRKLIRPSVPGNVTSGVANTPLKLPVNRNQRKKQYYTHPNKGAMTEAALKAKPMKA